MYNYGNEDPSKQLHYVNLSAGFKQGGGNRFEIGYGKKEREYFALVECVNWCHHQTDLA